MIQVVRYDHTITLDSDIPTILPVSDNKFCEEASCFIPFSSWFIGRKLKNGVTFTKEMER